MDFHLYLRKGTLFLPTTALVEKGLLRDIEPVAVLPLSNTEDIRQAFHATIARGNPATPHYPPGSHPQPVILKHAGLKTWSTFAREAKSWSIREANGIYWIVGYRKDRKGYWEEDPERKTRFPPGATIDDVIGRMIAILQDAAKATRVSNK